MNPPKPTPFKPEDFDPKIGPAEDGQELCTYRWAAERANARLHELLSGPVWLHPSNASVSKWSILDTRQSWHTHTAWLFQVTKIEREECEHDPDGFQYTREWTKSTCRKCGVKLKAKWEAVEQGKDRGE